MFRNFKNMFSFISITFNAILVTTRNTFIISDHPNNNSWGKSHTILLMGYTTVSIGLVYFSYINPHFSLFFISYVTVLNSFNQLGDVVSSSEQFTLQRAAGRCKSYLYWKTPAISQLTLQSSQNIVLNPFFYWDA